MVVWWVAARSGVADVWFRAQRRFYVGASKAIGDQRGARVFPNKILRRAEVTAVRVISAPQPAAAEAGALAAR